MYEVQLGRIPPDLRQGAASTAAAVVMLSGVSGALALVAEQVADQSVTESG